MDYMSFKPTEIKESNDSIVNVEENNDQPATILQGSPKFVQERNCQPEEQKHSGISRKSINSPDHQTEDGFKNMSFDGKSFLKRENDSESTTTTPLSTDEKEKEKPFPYNLPGTIVDENQMLAATDFLQSKYDKLEYPTIQKKADWKKPLSKVMDTTYFRDNVRPIDFILAYEDGDQKQQHRRKVFHNNLVEEGLELEKEDKQGSESGVVYYVKVHAPWTILVRYAEVLKLKKPIKKDAPKVKKSDWFAKFGVKNPFLYDETLIAPEPQVFSAGFQFHRQEMFLIKDREQFFTPSQRSLIVWEILKRVKYSSKDLGFGITRLLASNTYLAAYPLHDGAYETDLESEPQCDRRLLYLEWSRAAKWYKKQPLHLVRRYFGDKMALYFAWLGFYTDMLIPAAIMGIFTFISGLFFMNSQFNKPSEEICNNTLAGNTTMCPICDQYCTFWHLSDSCLNSKITFLFDNPATVVFAIAMSFWATMFLELWKRKQVVIQWQWDMENFEDEEELRPQYEERVGNMKVNPVTKKKEPYLPFWNKISRYVAANSLVLLMLLLVMAAVFGVILYRLVVGATMYRTNSDLIQKNARLVTSITAASMNLLVILILNFIYEKIVFWLTDLEMPRTQTEYEDSFTLKMFLFQSINYYSSLIYIAYLKGRFFYYPGDKEVRSSLILGLRYDMCDPAGCLFELCVQLAIIMVGKQFFNNVVEILLPILRVWWNKRHHGVDETSVAYTRWEQDYDLTPYTRLSLFNEYLEMVIQYGFVTLFVSAFPLAPFFALLNNVFEIRIDAYKYLTKVRRPLPQRVQDIGIWFDILKAITYMSVLTNALVISYTSDFIPRLVYMYAYSKNNDLQGYILDSLAVFNVSEYGEGMGPDRETIPVHTWPETCRYQAYRNPPDSDEPYEINIQFWHVFTARLTFIIIFEHIVFLLTSLVSWAIPDIPNEVKNQMNMEKKVEKEALFDAEMKKIKEERHLKQTQMNYSERGSQSADLGDGGLSPFPGGSRTPSRTSMHSDISTQ